MPKVSEFYGIVISMFFRKKEHNPPHIHVDYGKHEALISIKDLKITGKLPKNAKRMTLEWVKKHQKELLKMWDSQEFKEIEPLD